MLTIHQQPTTGTLQIPPELLHKVITWVLAQSVHSICALSDDVEWELKLMETLCLVSSAFRDIALEVACKAFGVEREENQWACNDVNAVMINVTFLLIQHCIRHRIR